MTDHPHGTDQRYGQGCRCIPCTTAHRASAATRRRNIAYGRHDPLINAHEAKQHIKQLRADGMTYEDIARATGLNVTTVAYIHTRNQRTHASRAALILNLTPEHTPAQKRVPSTGTKRRIQGLQYQGWTQKQISEAAGIDVRAVIRHDLPNVAAASEEAVRLAANKLMRRPQPDLEDTSKATRKAREVAGLARKKGWVPIMAWDDIDDPAETYTRPTLTGGRPDLSDADLAALAHQLVDEGRTLTEIASAWGYASHSTVARLRARHPKEDS